jgi:hypothetical protein
VGLRLQDLQGLQHLQGLHCRHFAGCACRGDGSQGKGNKASKQGTFLALYTHKSQHHVAELAWGSVTYMLLYRVAKQTAVLKRDIVHARYLMSHLCAGAYVLP